ncbi:MAG TPA: TauD/TfdA family dioxygenase [Acidimicrobiia bacterium]|nr:TauD/TfdA family dioxygenase [Acidimicrobiia bacterium]
MTSVATPALDVSFDVRPIAGHIGAEIHGVDLREPLPPSLVAEIRATLLRWKVVFFRDQDLTQAQHVAFGRYFGDVTPAHPTLPAAFPEHPEILLLDNQRYSADSVSIESRWHTDVTFVPNPPMASILRGVVVPPYGGDTQFSNLVAAYEKLSAPIRDLIDGLHAVHHNVLPLARGEMPAEMAKQFMSADLRAVHPVVRVHPETGERAIFVNPNFTSHVVELSRKEGRHLLELLYEQISNPEYTCRFRWEPGSIAFWDNRATAHLVPTDVPAGFQRSMQRITLAGDVPVGVDGRPSHALAGDTFA